MKCYDRPYKPWMYTLTLIKRRFDIGLGVTSYLKYAFALFGFLSLGYEWNPKYIIWAAIVYVPICFMIGWAWIRYGFLDAESEIDNKYDPFAKELRGLFNIPKDDRDIKVNKG